MLTLLKFLPISWNDRDMEILFISYCYSLLERNLITSPELVFIKVPVHHLTYSVRLDVWEVFSQSWVHPVWIYINLFSSQPRSLCPSLSWNTCIPSEWHFAQLSLPLELQIQVTIISHQDWSKSYSYCLLNFKHWFSWPFFHNDTSVIIQEYK